MKKVIIINLGGQVIHIDEDASLILQEYLKTISNKLKGAEGEKEIYQDIAIRITELFQERLNPSKQSISTEDVQEVIATMGYLEDLENPEVNEENPKNNFYSEPIIQKRLFRNPDNKVIGGVCGGVGSYFGIDPIWLRLALLIALFAFGSGFLLYIILWIVIPKARTAADKLAMTGVPINAQNIKDNFSNFTSDTIGGKVGHFFEQLFGFILRTVARLAKFIAFIVIFIIIITLITFLGSYDTLLDILPVEFFHGNPIYKNTSIILGLLIVLIPTFWAIFGLTGFIGKRRLLSSKINGAFGIIWALSILGFVIIGFRAFSFSTAESTLSASQRLRIKSDTVIISTNPEYNKPQIYSFSCTRGKTQSYINGKGVTLHIEPIPKDSALTFEIIKSVYSKNPKQADQDLKQMNYGYAISDNKLLIDPSFEAANGFKIGQSIELILHVPEGKAVYLDPSIKNIIYDIDNKENIFDKKMVGHYWKMQNGTLICLDHDFGDSSRTHKKKGKSNATSSEDEDDSDY